VTRLAVALALLVGTVAATPYASERAHLAARWAAASHRSISELDAASRFGYAPRNLRALADRELAIPGRYELGARTHGAAAQSEPWWLRVYRWLYDRWMQVWNAFFGRVHVSRNGAIAIADVLIVAVALLLIFVAVRLSLQIQRERRARAQSRRALVTSPSAGELYRRASEFGQCGNYADACRLLFAATIAALDVHAVVEERRSATVGEMRRALRKRAPALLAPFDVVTGAFATVAYAERPVGLNDWERARDAYRAIGSATR
jgi:hypothetical protein